MDLGWKFPPQTGLTIPDPTPKAIEAHWAEAHGFYELGKSRSQAQKGDGCDNKRDRKLQPRIIFEDSFTAPVKFSAPLYVLHLRLRHNLENTSENVAVLDIKSSLTQGPNRVTKYTTRRFFYFYVSCLTVHFIYHLVYYGLYIIRDILIFIYLFILWCKN